MRAIFIEKPHEIKVIKVLDPIPKGNESLIKVLGCGVCGTDSKIYKGETLASYPLIPGHEIVGEIVESKKFEKGTKVTIDPNKPCGVCEYCREGKIHLCMNLQAVGVNRDGGFAELLSVPNDLIYEFNKDISIKNAIFAEPLSCIIHGLDLSNFSYTDDIAIIGGGAIGLIFSILFNRFSIGGKLIFEISQEKIDFIKNEFHFPISHPENFNDNHNFDIVFECSGSLTGLELAYSLVKKGGKIIDFGVTPKGMKTRELEPFQIYSQEITLIGSYINPFTMQRAVKIINSNEFNFEKLVTDEGDLDEVKEYISANKKPFLKAAYVNK
ncbi:alcohol dehydrogenase catalytic domain-containing protein [Petrotoga sp. 9PWA.NaAc.5.4]|uniref:alcohol dehydrogenase catalytic domain-containing protein n=1 Tax=Petrotoga sp. 9PWA.NaAc.5.4 TaxID=1434328 RepID=UPI000CBF422B|nr:alcohol dehydrogenase catalytic domain-containing protein [Petrotoga sp. 9PWA.NaAc.5.4]PNR95780.1 alcohol dehydrogenase [Petrotoga sp. 9PWA.NaAc.5.4]